MGNVFTNFLFGPFLTWSQLTVGVVLLFCAAYRYVLEREERTFSGFFTRCSYRFLARISVGFYLCYAIISTIGQYYIWKASEFTSSFLQSPVGDQIISPLMSWFPFVFKSPFGYFLFYSWGHFWVIALLSIAVAWIFKLYLRTFEKRNERFFYPGEVDLGFLCALVLGWPRVVLFIPVFFLCVLFVSLFRTLVIKTPYTTFGYPFLLGVIFTLPLWNWLHSLLRLYQLAP